MERGYEVDFVQAYGGDGLAKSITAYSRNIVKVMKRVAYSAESKMKSRYPSRAGV